MTFLSELSTTHSLTIPSLQSRQSKSLNQHLISVDKGIYAFWSIIGIFFRWKKLPEILFKRFITQYGVFEIWKSVIIRASQDYSSLIEKLSLSANANFE